MDFGGGDMGDESAPADDKPFDDKPFDAGVEADEQSDPKKYIEQLTGKLGQSLRTYNEEQGQPDFELEKFAINSLLSATHTSEMDGEDQKDIINKIKKSGNNDEEEATPEDNDMESDDNTDDFGDSGTDSDTEDFDDSDLEETILEEDEGFFLINPKKSSIFAPEGSEEANFKHKIVEKLHESFNQDEVMNSEPMVEPQIKPAPEVVPAPDKVKPSIAPSRKNKPFLPMPNVQPNPKAKK